MNESTGISNFLQFLSFFLFLYYFWKKNLLQMRESEKLKNGRKRESEEEGKIKKEREKRFIIVVELES